ncbi:MAG: asparagine synthase (glutamine-hydrolyzing) [Elusimicrobiota bacterium]
MCGIAGVQYFDPDRPVSPDLLSAMNDRILHRGPDDAGQGLFGSVGLAMRRLAVIDLEAGRQPMRNEDGTVWTVFNGEIYNFRELRSELQATGHVFRTGSDTEVLVHGYEEHGEDFAARLSGMFGFALWDAKARRLLLGRDHVGIKPLFYYLDENLLAFASEVKALLACSDVPREVDPAGLDEFMTLEYTLAPRTLLKGVRKLRPGHLLISENGRVREKRWWRPRPAARSWSLPEAARAVREELRSAVGRHLVSDVPLGAFLSGGVDSSILVGLMAELQSSPVKTFSIGFEDASYNELGYARLAARRFGTEHHEFILKPDPRSFLDDFTKYLDEPIGDVSILPTFLVSQKARARVTVALAGDGGDELFGGYDTYLAQGLAGWYGRLPRPLRAGVESWAEGLRPAREKKGAVNRLKRFLRGMEFPTEIRHYRWMSFLTLEERRRLYTRSFKDALSPGNVFQGLLDRFDEARPLGDALSRMSYVDLRAFLAEDILAKVDVASMANSLEVRVPFLDPRVVDLALSLPEDFKIRGWKRKHILKRAFRDLLPTEIMGRGKEGFSIPMKNWLRGDLREALEETLHPADVRRLGFFDPAAVETLKSEHASGRRNHAHPLWCLMVFHLWHRKFIAPAFSSPQEALCR